MDSRFVRAVDFISGNCVVVAAQIDCIVEVRRRNCIGRDHRTISGFAGIAYDGNPVLSITDIVALDRNIR